MISSGDDHEVVDLARCRTWWSSGRTAGRGSRSAGLRRRPSVVDEQAGRVCRPHGQERIDRVAIVVEEQSVVAVRVLQVLDVLRPAVRVEEVDVVLEVAFLAIAASLRVLDAELDVVRTEEPFGIVREIDLDRVAAGLLRVDVRERAVDAVVGPLPPVDVAGMIGRGLGKVLVFVFPESQELGARERVSGGRPLPLGRGGVVLRLRPRRSCSCPTPVRIPSSSRCRRCSRSGTSPRSDDS